MNLIKLLHAYLYSINILNYFVDCLTISHSLKREIRYSLYDVKFRNNSTGVVLESSIKQYKSKQVIYLHLILHKRLIVLNSRVSVSKCKDYYVDCVNVISYDITDLCFKLDVITNFGLFTNTPGIITRYKCPLYGEYFITNMTLDEDKFGAMYSVPSEKWWEFYWILDVYFLDGRNELVISFKLKFYFIQFRSRN